MANYSMKYWMQLDAYRSTSVEKILVLLEVALRHGVASAAVIYEYKFQSLF